MTRPGDPAAARNFIVFFVEKVGSTALMSLLERFRQISVVRVGGALGLEPFDRHNCGAMPLYRLRGCLNRVFGTAPVDMAALNRRYLRTGQAPLASIDAALAVGFKMRFRPPRRRDDDRLTGGRLGRLTGRLGRLTGRLGRRLGKRIHERRERAFAQVMFDVLQRHRVVVFVLVRDDLLRWALSRYHGDGSGNPGHMQFALAAGELQREDVGTLRVDCDRLQEVIERCRADRDSKLDLHERLTVAGIDSHLVSYERFLHQRRACVGEWLECLGIRVDDAELEAALGTPLPYRKVHPDRIEAFVENHQEVLARFGHLVAPAPPATMRPHSGPG